MIPIIFITNFWNYIKIADRFSFKHILQVIVRFSRLTTVCVEEESSFEITEYR